MSASDGPQPASRVAIALGSNLGDRMANIRAGLDGLARLPGTALDLASPVVETEPVGGPEQGPYLNAAATIRTTLRPRDLLDHLLDIERHVGRDRSREVRWGPRTLDLDLLIFDALVIDDDGLTIPHPRMHERGFVLQPLATIAPDWRVPTLGRTVQELCSDLGRRTSAPQAGTKDRPASP